MGRAGMSWRRASFLGFVLAMTVGAHCTEQGSSLSGRQLLVRPRHREGRRTHNTRDTATQSQTGGGDIVDSHQSNTSATQSNTSATGNDHTAESSNVSLAEHNAKNAKEDAKSGTGSGEHHATSRTNNALVHSHSVDTVGDSGLSVAQTKSVADTGGDYGQSSGGQQQVAQTTDPQLKSYDVTTTRTYSDWDGQRSWEWENPKTLYFEPVAGLGNRLRALASAVVVARESGIGLKVIWREEVECGIDCGNAPPFNSTWPDLFSYPKLRLAPNFPGSNYSVHKENIWLRPNMSLENPEMPSVVPGFNCSVHNAQSYIHLKDLIANSFTHVNGEQVLCVKSDLWLTRTGESEGKFFFRLLQPSPPVKKMLDDYKRSVGWDDKHFVGVHIRRTDLAITAPDGTKKPMDSLVSLSKYVDTLRRVTALAPGVQGINYFVATDDVEAEKIMRSSFEDGRVFTYPKTAWSRSTVEGIQQALVDVLLLADCPVLIGTYYSSYSETAKLIGWPYYIQIGQELTNLSLETKFETSQ